MSVKVGRELRRFINEGKGESALQAVLKNVLLTSDESHSPFKFAESLRAKSANAEDINLQEVFDSFFGSPTLCLREEQDWNNWRNLQRTASQKAALGIKLEEAEVMSNQFQLLTQAKLYTTMMATYELTKMVFEQFYETFSSPFKTYKHQIPSDAPTVEHTPEGQDYVTKPLSDRYAQTKANKFGAIIPITRETILTDRMGQVVAQSKALAASAKYREDELAAYAIQDATNKPVIKDDAEVDAGSYWPEETNVPLYRTAAGTTKPNYEKDINKVTNNDLNNWKQLETAIQLMLKMTNLQNQYIETIPAGGLTLLVPFGLAQRANLLQASVLSVIDQNVTPGSGESVQMRPMNPLENLGVKVVKVVVWNKLATAATASQSTWYLVGNAKNQMKRHMRWDVEFNEATPAQLGGDDFVKDVIYKVRGGFNTGFRAVDGKFIIQNTHS